jgi:hypothetical protein
VKFFGFGIKLYPNQPEGEHKHACLPLDFASDSNAHALSSEKSYLALGAMIFMVDI